jgi:glutathione synthase/RimK-type ligase-like ATP-grasp enzyme
MRVAIVTFTGLPPEFADDQRLAAALEDLGVESERIAWDEPNANWRQFGAVVIRSTWDYARRRDEFLAWAESAGDRLHNSAAVLRWNSDKLYLGELAEAGFATVSTTYVAPADSIGELGGEIVVKPTISAGGRDTGRFGPAAHEGAQSLIAAIQASGRTAMVQPYQPSVDSAGETAVVCLNGEPSHVLRKRAVLGADEIAPVRDDALGAAEIMYDPGLVTAGEASERELALAREVIAHVAARFGYMPLYARVDLLQDADGMPLVLELEAVEPNLYLDQVEGASQRVAEAIVARL